jgi:hypothetical protein
VRRRKRPHQPGAATRDPARLTLTSRRNTQVAANAPEFAFRQDRREAAVSQPRPVPDPPSARRQISLTKPPPTPESSRPRNHPNRAKYEIPIDRRRNPAGSCLGGFPTPDGIRKPSPTRSHADLRDDPGTGHSPPGRAVGCAPNPVAQPHWPTPQNGLKLDHQGWTPDVRTPVATIARPPF